MSQNYFIFSNGRLQRKDNTLYFVDCAGIQKALPIEQVDNIHIFGEVDINTKMLSYISQYGTKLNFYNYYGFYSGSYYPKKKNVSGYTVVNQSRYYLVHKERMNIAKLFIEGAVHHILRNMRRHNNIPNEIFVSITKEKETITKVSQINELMGIEGRIRHKYYESFNYILKDGFNIERRQRRPPQDPVNALISFGNSIMYTAVLSEIYKTQLDPTISYLHEPSTKRFSLSLDIAEIFKPLIIDPLIFNVINNRIITKKDFDYEEGLCYLNVEGRKKFLAEFEKKMVTTIKHRKLNRKVSYRYFIRLECYKLIKHFINDEVYKPLKAWW